MDVLALPIIDISIGAIYKRSFSAPTPSTTSSPKTTPIRTSLHLTAFLSHNNFVHSYVTLLGSSSNFFPPLYRLHYFIIPAITNFSLPLGPIPSITTTTFSTLIILSICTGALHNFLSSLSSPELHNLSPYQHTLTSNTNPNNATIGAPLSFLNLFNHFSSPSSLTFISITLYSFLRLTLMERKER